MKDAKKQEEMWERQHQQAAHKIYSMCSDLGGFFLKVPGNFTLCALTLTTILQSSGVLTVYLLPNWIGIYIAAFNSCFCANKNIHCSILMIWLLYSVVDFSVYFK